MSWFENKEQLALEYDKIHDRFESLFKDLSLENNLNAQKQELLAYYANHFVQACKNSEGTEFLEEFDALVTACEETKSGKITAVEGFEIVNTLASYRKTDVILDNIFKILEALFLFTVCVASFMACVSVGIPLMFLEPFTGAVTAFATALLAFVSFTSALQCFDELKSTTPVANEKACEAAMITFFKPAAPKPSADNATVSKTPEEPAATLATV